MRGVVILFFFSPPFPLERRCYTLTLRAAEEEEEEEGGGALSSPFPPFLFPLGNHAKGGRWDQRPLPLLPPLFFGVGGGEARPPTPPTTMIYAREEWRRFTYGKDPTLAACLAVTLAAIIYFESIAFASSSKHILARFVRRYVETTEHVSQNKSSV